jgi:hypothetical protein
MQLSPEAFDSARTFVKAQARPLDQRLFEFYFEAGSAAAVLAELAHYQNDDGGFGRALEPDFRLVASSPLAGSLDYEIQQQTAEGCWAPMWQWGQYEESWPQAEREWKGHLTVKTLRALQNFGRIL